jgi:hypothetical protein
VNSAETLEFARRLMREVWEPFDYDAVPRFYRRDVVGHHRKQELTYDDVVHRLVTDHPRYPNPKFEVRDIVAAADKFALRFIFTADAPDQPPVLVECNYFYHLKEGKIAEFWHLASIDFDYKAND